MAKQKGALKVQGTLDDLSFFKSQDGYMVRMKGGIDGKRIKNDPAFQRTRENLSEFGHAGKSGKLLRLAIRPILQNAKDDRVSSRLLQEFMRVLHADKVSARGLRNVTSGDLSLLTNFDFNSNGKLSTTLFAPYSSAINRVAGDLTITIPPFVPGSTIAAPAGATHVKFVSSGLEMDFVNSAFTVDNKESAALPINNVATAAMNIVHHVTPASTNALFLLLGIQFLQDVNGSLYPLKNGAFNALSIIKIDS